MDFLANHCTFSLLTSDVIKESKLFDCEHEDLNDFFANDCIKYSEELLGKTYCFRLDQDPAVIVCAFTISNDSIKANFLPNSRKKKVSKPIPREKQFRSYPAVLIGRLGVSIDFRQKGIGKELLDFVKSWFVDPANKTGCRFIVVDSYNEEKPLRYYENNGFQFLFTTEEQERNYTGLSPDQSLKTRLMYFDLIHLSISPDPL
ncbi:MAG: GNAT family N-acetyltransferase [Marinoscillum sp.]